RDRKALDSHVAADRPRGCREMCLGDLAKLDEGDRAGEENPDRLSLKAQDDGGQPDRADNQGDGRVQGVNLLGIELPIEIEDPQCQREDTGDKEEITGGE